MDLFLAAVDGAWRPADRLLLGAGLPSLYTVGLRNLACRWCIEPGQ